MLTALFGVGKLSVDKVNEVLNSETTRRIEANMEAMEQDAITAKKNIDSILTALTKDNHITVGGIAITNETRAATLGPTELVFYRGANAKTDRGLSVALASEKEGGYNGFMSYYKDREPGKPQRGNYLWGRVNGESKNGG